MEKRLGKAIVDSRNFSCYTFSSRRLQMTKINVGNLKISTLGLLVKTVIFLPLLYGLSLMYAASWTDYTAPIDDRVADLMTKLSLQEKISERNKTAPAISRLSIGSVQWWTEAQNGWSTIFPASIAKACTWDPDLMLAIGKVYGDEARFDYKKGQQFYSPPVVNIAMDPRWGRNDEGWGEDPFLCGKMVMPLIRGAQGDRQYPMPGGGETYLKVSLMAKHYIANNHENDRFNDISSMDERDFYEYFLPPFKSCVDADVGGIMCGLNKITIVGKSDVQGAWNTECAFTLDTLLRLQWGWKGYTTSDCGNVRNHPLSMERGLDAECFDGLEQFFDTTTVNKTALNRAVSRLYRLRFRMGEFDPASACPYLSPSVNMTANAAVELQAAHEVPVLMKNTNNMLPLSKTGLKKIALVGQMARHPTDGSDWAIYGGYSRTPAAANITTVKSCMTSVANANGITLTYVPATTCINSTSFSFSAAEIAAITAADVVVGVVGTDNKNAGFANAPCQGDSLYPGEQRDLPNLQLPGVQEAMLRAVYGYNHKLVVVLQDQEVRTSAFIFDTCPAVLLAFPGGQALGHGITDVLFGDFNPSGKLSQTWMRNISDYPGHKDYRVREGGRTYLYFTKPVFFPFGHGLSYTTFAYANIAAHYGPAGSDTVATISFDIQNTGTRAGAEVAQLYVHAINPSVVRPIKELRNYKRADIAIGAKTTISLAVTKRDLAYWSTTAKAFVADNGMYEIQIGSSSADIRLRDTLTLPTTSILSNFAPGKNEQLAAQNASARKTMTMQRVFVDSRTAHFSFDPAYRYDIYTCNGRKVTQSKGADVNTYLSHATRGIYLVMGQKKAPQ